MRRSGSYSGASDREVRYNEPGGNKSSTLSLGCGQVDGKELKNHFLIKRGDDMGNDTGNMAPILNNCGVENPR